MQSCTTSFESSAAAHRASRRVPARAPAASAAAMALAVVLGIGIVLLLAAPPAGARTFSDVPSGFWARTEIGWVTNQGIASHHVLDDYKDGRFRPNRIVTRRQLARALVLACEHEGDTVAAPVKLADVPADDRDYGIIQIALHLKLMAPYKDGFRPDANVLAWQADRAVVRMVKVLYPTDDWGLLSALNPADWEPNKGWKVGGPRYLAYEVAARYLNLRFNHLADADAQEVSPGQGIGRDEIAYLIYHARHLSSWQVDGLGNYGTVTLPKLTTRQKAIVRFAAKYIGYPYVWGGEYPTKDSPYGRQAHGGFDCSGFDWWVMKIHFGYKIGERTAADMAAAAKPRITRAKLVPGDLIFFGPKGRKSTAASIYHAALYLGNGWFIHSTGSFDGVGISSLVYDSYWKAAFAWGRRVLKAGQFTPLSVTGAIGSLDLAPVTSSPSVQAMPITVPPDADPTAPEAP